MTLENINTPLSHVFVSQTVEQLTCEITYPCYIDVVDTFVLKNQEPPGLMALLPTPTLVCVHLGFCRNEVLLQVVSSPLQLSLTAQ